MANQNVNVLDAVTIGTSEAIDTLGQELLTMNALFSSGVSAGVVTFEASPDSAFAGTWKNLGTASFTASANVTVSVEQAHRFVRARVTQSVVGGTVTVWITTSGKGHGWWRS